MNRRALVRSAATAAAAAALLLLAACSGAGPNAATPSPSPTPTTPPPAVQPSATPTAQADPACDTIIPADLVADFGKTGWTFEKNAFRIGETELPGGLTCTWGDPEQASDHVQMFGWAPIAADEAVQQETALVQQGWVREEGGNDGVYITEDPESAVATDADGYGWTYLFGDGWVKFADTKQSLLLVDWPPSS